MRALVVFFFVLTVTATASAQRNARPIAPEAEEHYQRGLRYYGEHDYARASSALARAYDEDAHPLILWAWAQSERLRGHCARAVELYQEYLSVDLSSEQRDAAKANIVRCRPAGSPDEDGAGASSDTDEELAAASDDDEREALGDDAVAGLNASSTSTADSPWYGDGINLGLLGLGAAGLGVGGWAYLDALDVEEAGRAATNQADYDRLRAKSASRRTLSISAAGVGLVAIGVAVTRIVIGRPERGDGEGLSVAPLSTVEGPRGLMLFGRF
jgi:hypothetical protein